MEIEFPREEEKATIQERFEKFHLENPHVFARLEKHCQKAIDKGRKRIPINMVFEVIRWEHFIGTLPTDGDTHLGQGEFRRLKLNNDFKSRYARLYIKLYPGREKYIEIRQLKAP